MLLFHVHRVPNPIGHGHSKDTPLSSSF